MPKARTVTPKFKAQLVLEVLSGAKTSAEVCRQHQIHPEEIVLQGYGSYHKAYQHISLFLDQIYPHERIYSALGYLMFAEFEQCWQQNAAIPNVKPRFFCPALRSHYTLR